MTALSPTDMAAAIGLLPVLALNTGIRDVVSADRTRFYLNIV